MTKVGEFFSFSCCISLKRRQIKSRRRHTRNRKVRTSTRFALWAQQRPSHKKGSTLDRNGAST